MPGAGKGVISGVASELGVPILSMGDVVREHFEAVRDGRPRSEIGPFADTERSKNGKEIWARRLADRVDAGGLPRLMVIEGVRSRFEVDMFRERWGDSFRIMAVHASPGTRLRRLLVRGRPDDPRDQSSFDERDRRELAWGIGEVIALADIVLLNEGTIEDLRDKARDILTILGWA
jgi:dephospho-CoA kinase